MKTVQITIKVENNKEETNLYDELIKEIKYTLYSSISKYILDK